ncbi:MAG: hypothetical protein WAN22_21480, partial [Solirubrobacteraceae bacterium]
PPWPRRGEASGLARSGATSPKFWEGCYALHRAGMPAAAGRPLAAVMSRTMMFRGPIRHA